MLFNPNIRWLSLRQASAYCPLGQKALIRLVKAGKIKGGQHGGTQAWFFCRGSIDIYMESMCVRNQKQEIENKVVEFFQGVK